MSRFYRAGATLASASLVLSLLPAGIAQAEPSDWHVDSASQRIPITINGGLIDGEVDNFPVLVTVDMSVVPSGTMSPDHLVFTHDGDSILPYEVEQWDPAGTSSFWVSVPSVGADTEQLYLYYDGAPENTSDPASVWDDGFDVVNHMATESGTDPDSTSHGHTLHPGAELDYLQDTASGTPGILLGENEYLEYLGDSGVGDGLEYMSFSTTVYLPQAITASNSAENHIVSRERVPQIYLEEDLLAFFAHNGRVRPRINAGEAWSDTPYADLSGPGWYDFAVTYDQEHIRTYINGELEVEAPLTGELLQTTHQPLVLGSSSTHAYTTKAGQVFDEFRLSNVARSSDWVKAEHLSRTGELISVAAPERATGERLLILELDEPTSGSRTGSDVTLAGNVNQLATLSYRVDDGESVTIGDVEGEFAQIIPGLSPGEHTVTVMASTAGQDPVSSSVTFQVDVDGPDITVHSPQDGVVYDGPVAINVEAVDEDGVADVSLLLNGDPVRNNQHILPENGEHVLDVTAVDSFGNESTYSVQFTTTGAPVEGDAWLVPEAEQRMPFHMSGSGLTEVVEDFPVLIQFGTEDVDYGEIEPEHLAFTTDDSEEPLPYEVEEWNTDGVSSVWVQVPELSAEEGLLYMYFDGAPASTVQSHEVWDDGFDVVTHMASTDGRKVHDSTGSGHELTQRPGTSATFDAVTDSGTPGIELAGGEALEYVTGPGANASQMTLTTVVYLSEEHTNSSSLENYIAAREVNGFGPEDQFVLLLHQGSVHPRLTIDEQWRYTDRVAIDEGWHTLSFSYDNERLVMLIDGVKVQDWETEGEIRQGSTLPLRLGEMSNGSYPASPGYIYDEFRLSNVARSEAWMRAEHLAASGQLVSTLPTQVSNEAGELTLEVTAPTDDTAVSLTPTLTGHVSKTAVIEFQIDGGEWTDLGPRLGGFSTELGELAGGEHTLTVRASAGEDLVTAETTFTVDGERPTITFNSPIDGENYGSDGVLIDVEATDNDEVVSLELRLDGTVVENGSTIPSDAMVGDDHVLEAVAVDAAGNVSGSSVSFIAVGTQAPDTWLVPEAKKRLAYVIQAPVSNPVQNFPVLFQFDDRQVDYSTIDPDHIVFTTADDPTPLPYDMERWYSSDRLSSFWVRVPEVTTEEQTIYMYFDGVPENETNPADVWDDHYDVVSHMEYETSPQRDVTGNGHEIHQVAQQGYRAGAENRTPSVQFDNTPGMKIDGGPGTPGADAANIMVSTTVSIPESLLDPEDSERHVIMTRGIPHGYTAGDHMSLYTQNGVLFFGIQLANGYQTVSAPVEAQWQTIAGSYDGSLMRLYVNGELLDEGYFGGSHIQRGSEEPLMLGSVEDGSMDATGIIMDEIRVSTSARNADWALLEYLSASTQLLDNGGMETVDSAPALYLGLPAPETSYGPGLLAVTGTTWEPLHVTFSIDGGETVDLGIVDGEFGTVVEGLSDGEHTIEVTGSRPSGRSTTHTATFQVDGQGPEITFNSPTDGGHYDDNFVIDVDAHDDSGVSSLDLTLDGETVQNGDTIDLVNVVGLDHTLVATATDTVGNVTETQVEFTAPGAIPAVPVDPSPSDGQAHVDPENGELSVLVSDASGDPLDVTFHWTYVGGADTIYEGSSTDANPASDSGELVDPADSAGTLVTEVEKAYPYQRFEVAIPESAGSESVDLTWTGSVPAGQRAQLAAWNHDRGEWVELATGTGDSMTLDGELPIDGYVVDGVATVLVQNRPAAILDDDSSTRILWLTDTQYYSAGNSPQTYLDITQWAVDNKESEDIAYAVHTGDIVDNANIADQWLVPDAAHRTWDEAGFPYGVLPGNHDINGSYSDFTSYHQWFPASRFENNPWYGGSSRNNADHYDVFSTPHADYLVLYLGTALTPVEFAWAKNVISSHPGHNVIIAAHHYLTMGGGFAYEYQGQQIYDQLVVPHDNVGMVIAGHHCSPVTRVQNPTEDRTVYEIMFDPQCNPNGGDGWLRYMDFDAEAGTMEHSTFSIKKDGNQYWPEGQPNSIGDPALTENENFVADYDLQTAVRSIETNSLTVAAQATAPIQDETVTADSGTRAVLTLDELEEDREYFWYVTATNQRGYSVESPVWSFTTGVEAQPVEPTVVVPDAVVFTDLDGSEHDSFEIPAVTGVDYVVDDEVLAAGVYPGHGHVTVTARAHDGYVLDGVTEWSHEFDASIAPVEPVKPTSGNIFYLADNWLTSIAHHEFAYGRKGDEVLVGDWDGDGVDTLGVRRGHTFYLNNALAGGNADAEFTFGRHGDEVLVGDWDGDGVDTLGVRRGHTYYLNNTLVGGNADAEFTFGRHGDEILVGDWDGDGTDSFAVRRGNTFYVHNGHGGGEADLTFNYGRVGDRAFAGDFDGDGLDTITLRRGNQFFINNELTGGYAQAEIRYGRAGDTVLIGDWNGDGVDTPGMNRHL